MIPDLAFSGSNLVSETEERSLESVLAALPAVAPRAPASRAARPAAAHAATLAAALAERPYLAEYLNEATAPRAAGARAAAAPVDAPDHALPVEETAEESELLPEELRVVWAEIAAKREEMEHLPLSGSDFVVKVRGGGWTARMRGTATDCVVSQAVGAARDWCRRYGLNIMASFAWSRYQEDAGFLAHAWTLKHQGYYDRWVAAGGGDYAFTEEDHHAVEASGDYQVVLTVAAEKGAACAERAELIKATRPTNP